MSLTFLALSILLLGVQASSEQNHKRLFEQWRVKHGRTYPTEEEYNLRFNHFQDTLARIKQQNLRSKQLNSTATFGLNKFSDLSLAEFTARLSTKLPTSSNGAPVYQLDSTAPKPPSSWDWRTRGGITGQKNEEQCGSCWAMTVAMAIESAYMIHRGKKNQQPLSVQQIIDCDTNDDGCNGGMPPTAYQYVVAAGGLQTNADYPYLGQDGTCHANKTLEQDPITGYLNVIPQGSKDEMTMAYFLATNQPISTAVDASTWSTYTGGVLMADHCGTNVDHGVQIVGYNGLDKSGYWIIRNMWGSDWGENGFIRLQFGANTCGLTSLPTAPTLPKM